MYNFKNTKKMKKLVFGLIVTILLSTASYGQNLRATFLEGKKSHKEIVDAYNKLSDTDQGLLWLEKFNQLLSVNLPKEHHDLIKKLRDDFKDGIDTEQSVTFFGIAAELAKITPAKDFGHMFESLYDYEYNGKFIDTKNLSQEFIDDVKNLTPYPNLSTEAKGNCSCRWCLGHQGHTGKNCKITDSGCGFLWLQSCNQCVFCL